MDENTLHDIPVDGVVGGADDVIVDPYGPQDEIVPIDMDGDGQADAAWGFLREVGQFALLDGDHDGVAEYIEIDTDGDGLVDAVFERDGDGWSVSLDLDQDGVVDQVLALTNVELASELPELWALLTMGLTDVGPDVVDGDVVVDPGAELPQVEDGQIVGDPFEYSDLWFQQAFDGSCLPASVAQIYSLYTGDVVTDVEFVQLANEVGGWVVDEDGTPGLRPEAAVQLLEQVGIDATIQTSDLAGLTAALEQGYSVMVAVDSGEIWYGEDVEDDQMDHALLVAGIDLETGTVYLSDTGTQDGNMSEVPLDTFLDSWQDSDNTMVVTEVTVDEFRSGTEVEAVPEGDEQTFAPVEDPTQSPIQVPTGTSELEALRALPDLTGDAPTPLETVTRTLVQHPWILLPVALAGVRLVGRAAR